MHAPPDLVAAADAVDLERVGDDLAHAPARIERRVRVLEDHLQLAPVRPQLAVRERRDVVAAEAQRAARRLEQPDEEPAERRLAAAGLADDAERLAAAHLERHAVDGVDDLGRAALERARPHREVLDEVDRLEQDAVRAHARLPAQARRARPDRDGTRRGGPAPRARRAPAASSRARSDRRSEARSGSRAAARAATAARRGSPVSRSTRGRPSARDRVEQPPGVRDAAGRGTRPTSAPPRRRRRRT